MYWLVVRLCDEQIGQTNAEMGMEAGEAIRTGHWIAHDVQIEALSASYIT